jgi:5'-deoxynucleotidase
MMNIVKLFSVSQSMSSINRYSQINLLHPESVLEHTGFVCFFTYLMCEEINACCDDKIDVGVALERATFHDVDEVVTGDIPRPTKYFSKESERIFNEIANQGIDQIIEELDVDSFSGDIGLKIKTNWKNSKNGPEGSIVALADLAAVVYKIWEEVVLLGNKKLILQGKQVFGYINEFSNSLEEMGHLSDDQKNIISSVIFQLLKIIHEVKKMEDPMAGTLASLNNPNNT